MVELAGFIITFVAVPLCCIMEHHDLDNHLMVEYFDRWQEDLEEDLWSGDEKSVREAQIRCAGWDLFFAVRLDRAR